jgi:hypothetical protein
MQRVETWFSRPPCKGKGCHARGGPVELALLQRMMRAHWGERGVSKQARLDELDEIADILS